MIVDGKLRENAVLFNGRGLDADEFRFGDAGTVDFLAHIGVALAFDGLEFHRCGFVDGLVEGADDAHIAQSFDAVRLGLAVFQDAIGEIDQFRGKLVAQLVKFPVRLAIHNHFKDGRHRIVVGLDDAELAFRADDFEIGGVLGPEAGGESGQSFLGKTKDGRCHFLGAAETRVGARGGKAKSLLRLIAKEITGGVDAVDADVVKRPAGVLVFGADISRVHLPW